MLFSCVNVTFYIEFYLKTLTGSDGSLMRQFISSATGRCSLTPRRLDRLLVLNISAGQVSKGVS